MLQYIPPMVKEFRYPAGAVFYRALNRPLPRAVRGEGCWIVDEQGRRYLDACGGAFVANIGHGVEEVAGALSSQARNLAYVNGTAFTHDAAEELAFELCSLAPPGLDHAYFLGSGSEAVEAALKLARQYWLETGHPEKHKIISLAPGYHGNTLLALSASARPHYRKAFGPWLVPVTQIPAPYAYRCACAARPGCPRCSGDFLEEAILKEGPESVAAFIAEPVGGSSTGASVARPGYWKRVRQICDRHKVLWIADEVLTGAGRTGRWAAVEHDGALPDLMTMGKGISGGYAPLSALLAPTRLIDALAQGGGSFSHAQTFSHYPVSCAAGLAAVRYIRKHDLVARADTMGKFLAARLETLRPFPGVGDVRTLGLLAGIEFVEDKTARAPFPRRLKFAEAFTAEALAAGLIVWPNTGQADGENGDLVMLAPPFVVSEEEIEEILIRFKAALDKTVSSIAPQIGRNQ